MKKNRVLALILGILLCAVPALGTIEYVDFDTGNDTTGTGAWDNPWLTIGKCTTTKTGGDECRVAKHTPAALTGNLTFTNGSITVPTSVDETSNVSIGDWVGLNDTEESWWRVAAITTDAITLNYQYWGPGTGVATQGYKAVYTQLSGDIDLNSPGVSMANRLIVSGGWTLSATPTQDGMSFLSNYGGSYTIMTANTNCHYIEISDIVFLANTTTSYAHFGGYSYGSFLHDIIFVHGGMTVWGGSHGVSRGAYTDIIQSGGIGKGFYMGTVGNYVTLTNCISYSAGTGTSDSAFDLNVTRFIELIDCKAYNAYYHGLYIANGIGVFASNLIVDTTRSQDGMEIIRGDNVFIANPTISNINDDGIAVYSTSQNVYITDPSFSNITSYDVRGHSSAGANSVTGIAVTIKNYNDVAGDNRVYFGADDEPPPYMQRDTVDARSGSCLKFFSFEVINPIVYKIGTVKVIDGGLDLLLYAYIKDDTSFNGVVELYATANALLAGTPEVLSLTDSYAQYPITVSNSLFATDDVVHLYITVAGTLGSVYVDDFSAAQ